jgi:hypothetical protein
MTEQTAPAPQGQQNSAAQGQQTAPAQGQQQSAPAQSQSQSAEMVVKDDKITINFDAQWKPGFYSVGALPQAKQADLSKKITDLANYIIRNRVKESTINVIVSESQVTNYNIEDGDTSKTEPLPQGMMAEYRAGNIKRYIDTNPIIQDARKRGYKLIVKTTPLVGQTPYTKGVSNPRDPKYQKDIFVRFEMELASKTSCLLNGTITVGYVPGQGPKHECDLAIFNLYINNALVGLVNLNNAYIDLMFNGDEAFANTEWWQRQANYRGGMTGEQLKAAVLALRPQVNTKTRKSDGKLAGSRSNTFTLTKELLAKAAPSGTQKLEFRIEPLVKPGSPYEVFNHDSQKTKAGLLGSHAEVPYITINLAGKNVFSDLVGSAVGGAANVSKTEITTVLVTDLCGVPLTTQTQQPAVAQAGK